jgi:hypothetical protein
VPQLNIAVTAQTGWDTSYVTYYGRRTGRSMIRRTPARIAALSAAVLAAALIAFFVVSALNPAVNTGPLGDGGTPGGICVPIAPGRVMSWGITYLGNTGSSDAVIEKVALVKARNARLVATYVVPITGKNEYGQWWGYPPARHLPAGVDWRAHQRVPGASVAPAHGLEHADLVTVIQPAGGPLAQVQAIDVFYRESGINYHMQTHWQFVFLVGQTKCPDDWPQKYPG